MKGPDGKPLRTPDGKPPPLGPDGKPLPPGAAGDGKPKKVRISFPIYNKTQLKIENVNS